MAERTGNPTFADAGRPGDEQILVPLDPLAGDQLLDTSRVESSRIGGCSSTSVHKPVKPGIGPIDDSLSGCECTHSRSSGSSCGDTNKLG
jgi:hypothetical protein